jgi:phage recombination protein Bet
MSTQLAKSTSSPLAIMAAKFNADPAKLLDTLKATVFSAARNNEELQALVIVSNQYGLNPLTKEIYAFPAKGGGIVPVVSVDGWANLANSHPAMDGVDFEWEHTDGKLISCTAIIYRKDRTHPVRVTEYLSECKRATDPWKMEHRMLRHKAFCQCVRIAFGFSGIYDEDEAERITSSRDVTPPRAENSPLFKNLAAPLPQTAASPVQNPRRDGEQATQNEAAESSLFEVEAVPLVDQVKAKLAASELKWSDVLGKLQESGIGGEEFTPIELTDEDTLKSALELWAGIEAAIRKEGK